MANAILRGRLADAYLLLLASAAIVVGCGVGRGSPMNLVGSTSTRAHGRSESARTRNRHIPSIGQPEGRLWHVIVAASTRPSRSRRSTSGEKREG